MNKIIYLVRGLPGSGKTTLVKLLDARHFETDNFFMRDGKYEFDPSKLSDAHRWCQVNVENTMSFGKNIVVSNTFTQEWELQPYFDLAEKYGYKVISLIVENRNNTESVHSVPKASIEKMKNRFEICL